MSTSCPKYLTMDSIYGYAYLVSSTDNLGTKSTLQVVTNNHVSTGVIQSTVTVPESIAELVTLNPSTGLFVGICFDNNQDVAMDYIVAGTVDDTTWAVSTLAVSAPYAGEQYSMSPTITRLSDTEFAIAFVGDTALFTRYGTSMQPHFLTTVHTNM